jgi:hypothetical protein
MQRRTSEVGVSHVLHRQKLTLVAQQRGACQTDGYIEMHACLGTPFPSQDVQTQRLRQRDAKYARRSAGLEELAAAHRAAETQSHWAEGLHHRCASFSQMRVEALACEIPPYALAAACRLKVHPARNAFTRAWQAGKREHCLYPPGLAPGDNGSTLPTLSTAIMQALQQRWKFVKAFSQY